MYKHLQERYAPRPPVNVSTLMKMKAEGEKADARIAAAKALHEPAEVPDEKEPELPNFAEMSAADLDAFIAARDFESGKLTLYEAERRGLK